MRKILHVLPSRNCVIGRDRLLIYLGASLAYGYFLSQLPGVHFKDFNNYLIVAEGAGLILLQNADDGFLRLLSNEPVWLLLNTGLSLFLDPDAVVRFIIFCGASSVAWLILRHYPQYTIWLILFMFLPQVIKNYLVHLRQGVAVAVFLWGWFSARRFTRCLLIGLTPLIHASFFFILILIILASVLRLIRFSLNLKLIIYLASGIFFAFSLSILSEMFGARQSEQYAFERAAVSGLGFFLWALVLAVMLSADNKWLQDHHFEIGIVCFYLATYWLIEVAARIFESGLIIILLAGLTLIGWQKRAFLFIVLCSGFFSWILQLGQPSFGFADY